MKRMKFKLNRKILASIGWLLVITGIIVLMGFIESKQKNIICEKVTVNIDQRVDCFFVEKRGILNMIKKEGIEIIGKPISAIDFQLLEQIAQAHPFVNEVEVYSTLSGELRIEVSQKKPSIRIMSDVLGDFYLDQKGERLPLSKIYTDRVLLANGNIHAEHLKDLFLLATFVNKNKFWNAQIQQIYVAWPHEIQLVTRVGRHKILLGDFSNIEEKLNKLFDFYQYGLNNKGWDLYSTIDLKYKNQVVCKKRQMKSK